MHLTLETDDIEFICEIVKRELWGRRGFLITVTPKQRFYSMQLQPFSLTPEPQAKLECLRTQMTSLTSVNRTSS
jgi:hypothetical protein